MAITPSLESLDPTGRGNSGSGAFRARLSTDYVRHYDDDCRRDPGASGRDQIRVGIGVALQAPSALDGFSQQDPVLVLSASRLRPQQRSR